MINMKQNQTTSLFVCHLLSVLFLLDVTVAKTFFISNSLLITGKLLRYQFGFRLIPVRASMKS